MGDAKKPTPPPDDSWPAPDAWNALKPDERFAKEKHLNRPPQVKPDPPPAPPRHGEKFFKGGFPPMGKPVPPAPPAPKPPFTVQAREDLMVEFSEETLRDMQILMELYPDEYGTTIEECASILLKKACEDKSIITKIVMDRNGEVVHLHVPAEGSGPKTVCGEIQADLAAHHRVTRLVEKATCPHCIITSREQAAQRN